ncbi:hypothetical protein HDU98_011451 [Podochytrium sp. JEL0797]|nr:hypothetical protein HDU98_011451 [Podochytrium sp. JEL0797]
MNFMAIDQSRVASPKLAQSNSPGVSRSPYTMSNLSMDQSLSLNPLPTSRNNSLPKLPTNDSQQLQQRQQQQQQMNASQNPSHQKLQQPPMLQLHMAASNAISLPFSGNTASFPTSEAPHAVIQSTWSLFASMSDSQRNQLLKGLLSKCSSKQVDLICTCLNLKISEPTLPGHAPTVFATDAVGKFAPQTRVATSTRKSTRTLPGTAPRTRQKSAQNNSKDPTSIHNLESFSITDGAASHQEITISKTPTKNITTTNTASTENHFTTPNLYIKLLNTTYDPTTLLKQVNATTSLETTRTLFSFLVSRASKQQSMLSCMQSLSREPIPGTIEALNAVPVTQQLLRCALEICGAKEATLYRVDEATGEVTPVASTWAEKEGVVVEGFGIGERVLGIAHLMKGEHVNVYNVKESDIYTDEAHEYYGVRGKCEVECVLTIPVLIRGVKFVGAIEVINKRSDVGKGEVSPYFSAEDEHMLKCLGCIWTIVLSTASGGAVGAGHGGHGGSNNGKGAKSDDIKMLMNTANFMSTDIDLNGLVRVVMQTAQELLNAERCALFIVDHKKKELWSSVAEGAGEIRIPINKGIAGYVATTGEVLNIPNAYQDPRFNRSVDIKTGFFTRNILCVPMRSSKGQILGVAQLINKMPDPMIFTYDDEQLLVAFGALAASTIEKNMIFQDLQTILDQVTASEQHLSKIVQGVPTVIMTLESTGKLVSIHHPELFHVTQELEEQMKYNSFDIWLGKPNAALIEDIRRAFKGERGVFGRNYELVLSGKVFVVSYTASEMISPVTEESMAKEAKFAFEEDPTDDAKEENKSDSSENEDEDAPKSIRASQAPKIRNRRVKEVVLQFEIISTTARTCQALLQHIEPQVVQKLLEDEPEYGWGKKVKATAVSIDLRNFSALCERLDAKNAFFVLNLFQSAANDAIRATGGIMDKICNEKATALFGIPEPGEMDSSASILAGMKLLKELEEINNKLYNCHLPFIQIGIGISTGSVLCGMVEPTATKSEFVMLGEPVSIATKIQEATKIYQTNFLICDKTQREIRDRFHVKEIDNVRVRGYAPQITLYEVLGPANIELNKEVITSTICFELGLSEYRAQNYSVAQLHFKKAIQTTDDGPSKMFVQRCQGFLEGKVNMPADWDGSWLLPDGGF